MFLALMAEELSDIELGKRLSAGRGYRRESIKEFAKRIDADRHDLTKWELGDFGSPARRRVQKRNRETAVERVQKATQLPPEFFTIDFNDLSEMATAWKRTAPARDAPAKDPVDLQQLNEEEEQETSQLSDSSEQPNGEQTHGQGKA